ncbi:hypothetical protein HHX48_03145 [Salinimonas sp. HHU 13199]|uniref:Potassium channel domain-containing protein n=1 Tax=Salinimonas profundi TaxID=2729140 RepID=A0ABR8LHE2_9ALTE|nr:ion channel [Salinimonas profundi]MBD3584730.1 hypothetical protein [Salinimonas profundi]
MVLAIIISLCALSIAVIVHLFNLSSVARYLDRHSIGPSGRTFIFVVVAVISQAVIALLFAGAYWLGETAGLGTFKSPAEFADIFYFSLTTITTLGLGSIEPTANLRMLAGVESATGFLLISCSASHVFKSMAQNSFSSN